MEHDGTAQGNLSHSETVLAAKNKHTFFHLESLQMGLGMPWLDMPWLDMPWIIMISESCTRASAFVTQVLLFEAGQGGPQS